MLTYITLAFVTAAVSLSPYPCNYDEGPVTNAPAPYDYPTNTPRPTPTPRIPPTPHWLGQFSCPEPQPILTYLNHHLVEHTGQEAVIQGAYRVSYQASSNSYVYTGYFRFHDDPEDRERFFRIEYGGPNCAVTVKSPIFP